MLNLLWRFFLIIYFQGLIDQGVSPDNSKREREGEDKAPR